MNGNGRNERDDQHDTKRFTDAVNRHGYGFQNAVLRRAHELYENRQSKWVFEASEFPVEVNGRGTRIDFVLWTHQTSFWLLGECKRVNPKLADWCFVRTRYVRRNDDERFIAEYVSDEANAFTAHGVWLSAPPAHFYHRGIEMRTSTSGDHGGSREPIEDAAGQVLQGVNGMVNFLNSRRPSLGFNKKRILLPVIFATANLWVCDDDLSAADLETGHLDPAGLKLRQVPYLYYQYHQSPGLKHPHKRALPDTDPLDDGLSSTLAREFIRTIPIVSPTGLDQFLRVFNGESLCAYGISG